MSLPCNSINNSFHTIYSEVYLFRLFSIERQRFIYKKKSYKKSLQSVLTNMLFFFNDIVLQHLNWIRSDVSLLHWLQHVPKINGEIPSADEETSDHQRLLDRFGSAFSLHIHYFFGLEKIYQMALV